MFPQAKKWPQAVAAIVIVIVVFKNPAGAAHLVNHAVAAINQFASGLNVGL
jgi:hypothetical protein